MGLRPGGGVLAVVLTVVLAGGCGGESNSGAEGRCHPPTPAGNASALPRALDPTSLGTLTDVVRQDGFVNVTAVAEGSVGGVHERVSRALEEAGYTIVGSENEVVEADVFFARGRATTGGAKVAQSACPGRVRITLFVGAPADRRAG